MNKILKNIIKPLVPKSLKKMYHEYVYQQWQKQGCPVPPPHITKQKTIQEYQEKYNVGVFIETGTYLGDMVEAQKGRFKKLYSIELSEELFKNAVKRFQKDPQVSIKQGDSGKVLPKVLAEISEPAVFWLDGHYSAGVTARGDKDCPIFEEIDGIFNAGNYNHVLLIDDARHFNGEGDYPTIDKLTEYIQNRIPAYTVEVKHDVIRYVKK